MSKGTNMKKDKKKPAAEGVSKHVSDYQSGKKSVSATDTGAKKK